MLKVLSYLKWVLLLFCEEWNSVVHSNQTLLLLLQMLIRDKRHGLTPDEINSFSSLYSFHLQMLSRELTGNFVRLA